MTVIDSDTECLTDRLTLRVKERMKAMLLSLCSLLCSLLHTILHYNYLSLMTSAALLIVCLLLLSFHSSVDCKLTLKLKIDSNSHSDDQINKPFNQISNEFSSSSGDLSEAFIPLFDSHKFHSFSTGNMKLKSSPPLATSNLDNWQQFCAPSSLDSSEPLVVHPSWLSPSLPSCVTLHYVWCEFRRLFSSYHELNGIQRESEFPILKCNYEGFTIKKLSNIADGILFTTFSPFFDVKSTEKKHFLKINSYIQTQKAAVRGEARSR
jgi:hypothetical protein